MTDFILRGSITGDDLDVKTINDKINVCLDWGRLRSEGIILRDAVLDAEGPPPSSWELLAESNQTDVVVEGVNGGIVFVECYEATGEYRPVLNGVVEYQVANNGNLLITLLDHDDPWLVRVVKP